MRRRHRWGVGLVSALLFATAACGPDPAPSPSPTPRPTPSASPTETELERTRRLDFEAAEKSYRTFRAEFNRVKAAGGAKSATAVMRDTAGGVYLTTFERIVENYRRLGDRQTGTETIGYVRRGGYSPEELILDVCEDSRNTMIIDKAGKPAGRGEVRVASVQVRKLGGSWKVWNGEGRKVETCSSE